MLYNFYSVAALVYRVHAPSYCLLVNEIFTQSYGLIEGDDMLCNASVCSVLIGINCYKHVAIPHQEKQILQMCCEIRILGFISN